MPCNAHNIAASSRVNSPRPPHEPRDARTLVPDVVEIGRHGRLAAYQLATGLVGAGDIPSMRRAAGRRAPGERKRLRDNFWDDAGSVNMSGTLEPGRACRIDEMAARGELEVESLLVARRRC